MLLVFICLFEEASRRHNHTVKVLGMVIMTTNKVLLLLSCGTLIVLIKSLSNSCISYLFLKINFPLSKQFLLSRGILTPLLFLKGGSNCVFKNGYLLAPIKSADSVHQVFLFLFCCFFNYIKCLVIMTHVHKKFVLLSLC